MRAQGDFFDPPRGPRRRNLIKRFEAFHEANLPVYDLFCEFALKAVEKRPYFGSQSVIERIRWYTEIETRGDVYKINNDYAAFYARMFHLGYPEHKDFFRTRKSVADTWTPPASWSAS